MKLKEGLPVWASLGLTGWREATVLTVATKRVAVEFANGTRGSRRAEDLRPRNPGRKGEDKPPRP